MAGETVHASAVLVGARAILIRGPSGSGKSKLVARLLHPGSHGISPFTRLVGDDRVLLAVAQGRLLVRPAPALAGLIEVRGFGVRRFPFEPVAVVGLVVDLGLPRAERMPLNPEEVVFLGVGVRRLAFPPETDPLPAIAAALSAPASTKAAPGRHDAPGVNLSA